MKNFSTEIEGKLYEALGVVRIIGQLQVEGGDEGRLIRNLETATWAARAAETIISTTLGMIEV